MNQIGLTTHAIGSENRKGSCNYGCTRTEKNLNIGKGVVGLKTIQKPGRLHLRRSSYAAERQAPISNSDSPPVDTNDLFFIID